MHDLDLSEGDPSPGSGVPVGVDRIAVKHLSTKIIGSRSRSKREGDPSPRSGVPVGVDRIAVEHLAPERGRVAAPHVGDLEADLVGDHPLCVEKSVG